MALAAVPTLLGGVCHSCSTSSSSTASSTTTRTAAAAAAVSPSFVGHSSSSLKRTHSPSCGAGSHSFSSTNIIRRMISSTTGTGTATTCRDGVGGVASAIAAAAAVSGSTQKNQHSGKPINTATATATALFLANIGNGDSGKEQQHDSTSQRRSGDTINNNAGNPSDEIILTTSSSTASSAKSIRNLPKSETEWKKILNPEQYYVLREEGTERPWSSPLNRVKEDGTFVCAGCGSPLFTTSKKFESGTGWPSFYEPLDGDSIDLSVDFKLIVPRVEVSCKSCGGHLGHVFDDGPLPTGKRYCMNGVAMDFVGDSVDVNLAQRVAERERDAIQTNKKVIREPFMAFFPGFVLDAGVAALFGSMFWNSYNNNNMIDQILWNGGYNGVPLDQIQITMMDVIPLGIAVLYSVQALQKLECPYRIS